MPRDRIETAGSRDLAKDRVRPVSLVAHAELFSLAIERFEEIAQAALSEHVLHSAKIAFDGVSVLSLAYSVIFEPEDFVSGRFPDEDAKKGMRVFYLASSSFEKSTAAAPTALGRSLPHHLAFLFFDILDGLTSGAIHFPTQNLLSPTVLELRFLTSVNEKRGTFSLLFPLAVVDELRGLWSSKPKAHLTSRSSLVRTLVAILQRKNLDKSYEYYKQDNPYHFWGPITPGPTDKKNALADPRLIQLDEFARKNPGAPISDLVLKLFPGLIIAKQSPSSQPAPPLPKKAPERWPSDPAKRKENPAQFATRVYRVWMDAEVLTRSILEELDPLLLGSLDNWLQNNRRKPNPEALPEGFRLLTIGQANDRWIERVKKGDAPFPAGGDDLMRFANALLSRAAADDKRRK